MAAKCAFCTEEAVKHGGEHIWDDWLNRALPTKGIRVRKRLSEIEPLKEYDARVLKEKLPVVCEKCNNTWMSGVTNRVRHAFSDMIIKGAACFLQHDDINLIAAFAFMKCIVADHAGNKDEPFFTRAVRESFRESLVVPTGIQMWIAAYQGVHRFSGKCSTGILARTKPGPFYGVEFYAFTYVVGQLVLQTVAPRWKDVRRRGLPLPALRPNSYWNPAVIRFWPMNGVLPLTWPPEKYIGDDTIRQFIDRFNAPINVRLS